MSTARRVGRWTLFGVGGILALVVLLRVGIGIYLSTPAGKAMVARKVGSQIGMPVEVTAVRVGLVTSSIGMRVFDPAAPRPEKAEVLAVESARADVSLFDLAFSRVDANRVALRGVNLTLHVDAEGKVVTTLPELPEGTGTGAVPTIELTGGRLTIRQDGRPEFALQNLNLTAEPKGETVKLTGTIDDPLWSKWTVAGEINQTANTGWVELTAPDAPLTLERLGSIPFVPPEVWGHVRADGRGAVKVRLWAGSDHEVHYAVDITPHSASLTLPDASMTLSNVTGTIRVEGKKITLVGTKAELAGGTFAADGTLDFAPEPTVVNLKVAAEKLDIQRLPPEWKLPRDFEGKLQGNADLSLRIHSDGRIEPEGGGEGKITDVKLLGFPADDIPIRLRKRGDSYEFHQPKTDARRMRPVANTPVRAAAPRQDKKEPPKEDAKKEPAKDDPTTLDATIRLRDIDIAQFLEKLKVDLGYRISGRVSVEASVAVALTEAASGDAYRFTGKISSPALTLEGLTIRDVSANMVYQAGKFTLTELSGKIDQPGQPDAAPGTFRGTLTADTTPKGELSAALTIDRIPLAEVLRALPEFQADAGGTFSGKFSVRAPYEKASEPTAWSGSGELTSSELAFEGRTARDVRFSATVEKGVLTLKDAALTLEGIPVTADGTLTLADKYPFTAAVRTTGTDVADLRKLVPEVELGGPVEGVLETETRVKGTASPFTLTATGSIKATKLTLGRSSANRVELKWALTEERFTVSDLKADTFGGTVSGSANVPLARDKAGSFEVGFKTLDAARATELIPDFPVRITGKISGKVTGAIPPAKEGEPRVGNLEVDVTAPKLTVQGIPAERLVGKAAIKEQALEYQLEGKTLGGSFEINGRYPGRKKGAPMGKDRGTFRLTGANLARLAPDLGFKMLAPLGGRLDAKFEFDNDLSAGFGTVTLRRLRWGDALLADELTGSLRLRDELLELLEVNARIADGLLRARGRMRLNDTRRNFFTLSLEGADARKLLGAFDAGNLLTGPLNLVVHGQLGSEMRGTGTVSLARGTVSGIQVNDLRVPFEFASAPGGFGRFSVREAAITAGTGRARGELTLNWGTTTRVEGQIRFHNLPLRTVVPQLGDSALFGNGRLTGRFDFGGSHVRSVDDLTGSFLATLNNTSVKEIPILRQATPFLNPTGLVKPFQSGDVRATLSRGVFRVNRLALANPAAQLFAEGTITTSGRVDLDVVAHTGAIGPDVRGLRLLGLRVPATGLLPLTLLRDVSNFLSNRTVRLSITGTTANPIVRVNVGSLLTEQAVRFFLGRYVIPAEVAGPLGLGTGSGLMNDRK